MQRTTGDFTFISRCGIQYRNQNLEPLGLSYRQADILLKLYLEPGVSQDDLAKRLVLNKSNVARQVASLEEEGYIRRQTSEKDRRVTRLYPTEKTVLLIPEIRQVFRDWNDYLMQALSEEEQERLKSLLSVVRARADEWMEAHRNG